MHIVIIEPEAKQDIAQAIQYYNEQRFGLGEEFLDEVKHLLMRVGENPRQYPQYRRKTRKTRLDRFPYLVLYRFDDAHAYIVAVMDGRQNPRNVARRAGKNPHGQT